MPHPNQDLINRFFETYGQRDMDALRLVVAEDVRWVFPGQNPFSGTKRGMEGVLAFFDAIGEVIGSSKMEMESLVTGVSDNYVVEAQHITMTVKGLTLDHEWCVLWKFADGRIVEGRHLAADQQAVDDFYNKVVGQP